MVVMILCLISGTSFARGGHRGGGGGPRGGGGCLWGWIIPAAILAPLYIRAYTSACYDRVVRQEYYTRDAYGNFVRVPPTVVRICP